MEARCTKCREIKSLECFYSDKSHRNGKRSWCKKCVIVAGSTHKKKNRDRINELDRANWRANHAKRIERQRKNRSRLRLNVRFRILESLRARVTRAMRREYKSDSTLSLLGCSIESFKLYIESKFECGMSWENYGRTGWHIDHIIPCALFDLSKPDHQRRCFHFSNLQPLWAVDNMRKGKSISGDARDTPCSDRMSELNNNRD